MLYEGVDWNMPESGGEDHEYGTISRLVLMMYYALTTLSTVGYGDFSPVSIAEKIVGAIILIFGVTFFSILMNSFIEVVQGISSHNFNDNDNKLTEWLVLIKQIKN